MRKRQNRYKEMERKMGLILLGELILFIFYMVAAGNGIVWLKVITACIAIIAAGLVLVFLFLTNELTRPRSLWMTVAAGSVIICILFSLVLNYPSPNPYDLSKIETVAVQTETTP
jgi:asparagine N-glycosylation enzyme membrane subunit Stt3